MGKETIELPKRDEDAFSVTESEQKKIKVNELTDEDRAKLQEQYTAIKKEIKEAIIAKDKDLPREIELAAIYYKKLKASYEKIPKDVLPQEGNLYKQKIEYERLIKEQEKLIRDLLLKYAYDEQSLKIKYDSFLSKK